MNIIERLMIKWYMTPQRFSRFLIQADESMVYNKIAQRVYGNNLGQLNMLTERQLDALCACLGSSDNVLDVGCGNGKITAYLSRKTGCTVKGMDFAAEATKKATEKYADDKVSFEEHDVRQLAGYKGRFSKIVAIDSLYFVADLKPVLEALISLLMPGGEIIIFYSHNVRSHGDLSIDVIEDVLSGSDVIIEKTDFTTDEIRMWETLKEELQKSKKTFKAEGNLFWYRARYMEAKAFSRMGKRGQLKRAMYGISPVHS